MQTRSDVMVASFFCHSLLLQAVLVVHAASLEVPRGVDCHSEVVHVV
jgi:hypothetical protein